MHVAIAPGDLTVWAITVTQIQEGTSASHMLSIFHSKEYLIMVALIFSAG